MSGSGGDNLLRQATYGVSGPDIYSGTAGIALFLAQLYAETGDGTYRATALGAIEQSVHTADQLFQQGQIGFYTGWPGVAVSASQIGRLIGDDTLASVVPRRLVERFPVDLQTHVMDLLSGTAGTVLAFLTLWRNLDNERYLAEAVRVGERLIAAAHHRGSAAWWPTRSLPGRRGLTGFAHGTAGIAFSLLGLYRATADQRFRQAAEAAIAFERRNFHQGLQNWLDLRYPVEGSRFGPAALASSVWCHGSGGIAISRLTAWNVLDDPVNLAEAQTAIEATSRWTEQHLDAFGGQWSLCHGLAGNAAILWWAARWMPDQSATLTRLALRVANAGLATLAPTGDPTALCASDEPGLMLGLAGIGHFYLALANPTIFSVLAPGA
jgi:lantibiotic modifying enzyme